MSELSFTTIPELAAGDDYARGGAFLRYALITAARNEAKYIGLTLQSVAAQTVLPVRWIIVSDGSTDGTDEIVKHYQARLPWISLSRLDRHGTRDFRSKVACLRHAYEELKNEQFEVIGNLDADISFSADYVAFLVGKLGTDPKLGVVGTRFLEGNRKVYDYGLMNPDHVSGGCQFFRRQCFEAIGGFTALPFGGEDWVAVTTARMLGWGTRSYHEKLFNHHRPLGQAGKRFFSAQLHQGKSDYLMGGHPIWQILRAVFQMSRRPYFIGGFGLLLGYFVALASRLKKPISPELLRFHRSEQMRRLRRFVCARIK
jgi:poly-beta-1,6-N-acetyl-D-glucosamine synthase